MSEEQQLADRTAQQEEGPAAARPRRWMIATLLLVLLGAIASLMAGFDGPLVYELFELDPQDPATLRLIISTVALTLGAVALTVLFVILAVAIGRPQKRGQPRPLPEEKLTRRRRWMIAALLGVLLALAGATLVYALYEPMYEASTWLQIDEVPPYVAYQSCDHSRYFVQTQLELIRSPLVLAPALSAQITDKDGKPTRRAIESLPVIKKEADPVGWLAERITAKPVGQSELFQISFVDADPLNAALIVNAVTNEYFKLRNQADQGATRSVIGLLEDEKVRREREVEQTREKVRALALQATGTDPYAAPSGADTVLNQPLADLQSRLTTGQVERDILQAEIRAVEEFSKHPFEVPEGMVQQRIEEDAFIQELKRLIAQKQLKLFDAETATRGVDSDPTVTRLKEEIQRSEAKLAQVRTELLPGITAEIKTAILNERKKVLAEMRSELEGRRLMEKVVRQRLEAERAKVIVGTGETLELEFKRAELARAQEVLNLIASRAARLRTEQRAPAPVTLHRLAEPPTEPIEPVPYKKMALVSLAGFCLPLVLLVLRTGFVYVRAKMTEKRVTPAAP